MNDTITMIKALSEAPGVSGFEDEAVAVIRKLGAGLGAWSEDPLRNLYLERAENRPAKDGKPPPVLMLDAHTDEVGFLVRAIRPNGLLDFIPLGGWVAANAGAHRVRVRNDRGEWLPGIITSKPPHYLSEAERKAPPDLAQMTIDVGAENAREAREDYGINIAAPVVPDAAFEYLENRGLFIGKAFDDRLGCAAILAVLQELRGESLSVNITASFTTQEEMGLRGAQAAGARVTPDIAICFEGSPADDTVSEAYAIQTALKKGPMLRHIDAKMITNPRFQAFALKTARENKIPVQEGVRTGGATNAGAIHLGAKGTPVVVVGLPVRYAHTHYGIAALADFEAAVRLGVELVRRIDAALIAGF